MNKPELLKELRELTQAGMKDCKDALEAADWDIAKASDIIKTKGLNVVSSRAGKVAAEGLIGICNLDTAPTPANLMVEVNCQTDFVANSDAFRSFVKLCVNAVNDAHIAGTPFDVSSVETARQDLVATTKENVVVRRWAIEESMDASKALVFPYLHSNSKIGVLLTLMGPSLEVTNESAFRELGFDLAMQVAAMNPLAVSRDKVNPSEVERQKAIFEAQLRDLKKPEAAWPKIMEGKFNKWYTEVCLLDQESVTTPKMSVAATVNELSTKLCGEPGKIQIINFVRFQAGEGIHVEKTDLASEVEKLSGVKQSSQVKTGPVKDVLKGEE